MTIEEVVRHFAAPSRQRDGSFKCKCPVHDDRKASLHISQKADGKIVFQCLAGCDPTEVIRAVGLSYGDLKPQANGRKTYTATERILYAMRKKLGYKAKFTFYIYRQADGKEVYRKLRIDLDGGDKECRYVQILDEESGKYKWGAPAERVLYRFPETLQAIKEGRTIYIPEGEKCVNAMTERGFDATTAGSAQDWRKEFSEVFRGADVVLMPDNDSAGVKLMNQIKADLTGIAKSIKTAIVMPGTPKGDVADFFQSGKTTEDFKALIDATPLEGLEATPVKPDAKPPTAFDLIIRTMKGTPVQSIDNFCTVLTHDHKLKGRFRFNEFSMRAEMADAWWTRYTDEIGDPDCNQLRRYIEVEYDLKRSDAFFAALDIVCRQNPYHPIRDLLNSLEWDGASRFGELTPRFLGAERSQYTTEVEKLLILGAITRIFQPGCKFDFCVVFCDQTQGTGKSTLARFLALKDEYFTDSVSSFEGKASVEALSEKWIAEVPEMLASINAKSVEAIKAYLSRQSDNYRQPYARFASTIQRQNIFVGSSNNLSFLPGDRTGARRFLPLPCHGDRAEQHPLKDETETRHFVEQLYAEGMELYRTGNYALVLPSSLEETVANIRQSATPEDSDRGVIEEYLRQKHPDTICTRKLFYEAFNRDSAMVVPKPWELKEISAILDALPDWERAGTSWFGKDYGTQRSWRHTGQQPTFIPVAEGDLSFN